MDPEVNWANRALLVLKELFYVLGVVVTLLVFSGVATLSELVKLTKGLPHSNSVLLVSASVFATTLLVGTGALVQQWRASQLRAAFAGCVWICATYDYYFCPDSAEHHRQEATIDVEATREGLNLLEIRSHWTGTGAQQKPSIGGDAVDILGPLRREQWLVHYVVLDRDYDKGERACVHLHWEFWDTGHTLEPVLAKLVAERIRKLKLRVHFDPTRLPNPQSVKSRRLKGEPMRVVGKHRATWDPNQRLAETTVSRPFLNRRYQLRWSWADAAMPASLSPAPAPASAADAVGG